jgi:predicted dithiol-disulfide oxidoreductase (DUF899 family)
VQAAQDELQRRGVAVAVVSFAEPKKLARYQERHHWPFPIFADPERAAYRAFTLKRLSWFRVFSPATLKLYWKLLREGRVGADYGGEDIYQGGGDFVLDRAGNILFAHRSKDPADRPAVRELLEEIERNPTVR